MIQEELDLYYRSRIHHNRFLHRQMVQNLGKWNQEKVAEAIRYNLKQLEQIGRLMSRKDIREPTKRIYQIWLDESDYSKLSVQFAGLRLLEHVVKRNLTNRILKPDDYIDVAKLDDIKPITRDPG